MTARLPRRLRKPALLVRAGLIRVCAVLAVPMSQPKALLWLAGLSAVALVGSRLTNRILRTAVFGLEALIWAFGVVATGGPMSPMLPYLIAPLFATGFTVSVPGAFVVAGAACLVVWPLQRIAASQRAEAERLTAMEREAR